MEKKLCATISCETCFYKSKAIHKELSANPYCRMDSKECLGNKLPWKYKSWVYRKGSDCYDDYFNAAGEDLRDRIDADILKDVGELAETKDKSTIDVLCNLAGMFCVAWTCVTFGGVLMSGIYYVVSQMVK